MENLSLKGVSFPANTGTKLEEIYFSEKEYTLSELLHYLANFWVPLLECHKCGRFSYCKYAKPLETDPRRAREIQCGVVLNVLDNFLTVSWSHITKYDKEHLHFFFNGLYYFTRFVYESERTIGDYLECDYLDWAGDELSLKTFGYVSHLRTYLDNFAKAFKKLEEFSTVGKWIVVEGESEKVFIERLGELGFFTSYVSKVEHYGGKGNDSTEKRFLPSSKRQKFNIIASCSEKTQNTSNQP